MARKARTRSAGTSAGSVSDSVPASTRLVEQLTSAVGSVIGERQRELSLLAALLVCTFAMVAILGFDPGDATLLRPEGREAVTNPGGPVGANLADAIFQLVGWGAYGTFVLMVACVLALARWLTLRLGWIVAGGAAYLGALGVLHLVFRPGNVFSPGGWAGRLAAELLESAIGTVGAWLALLGLLTASVTWLGDIRWSAAVGRGADVAETWVPWAASGIRSLMAGFREVSGAVASRSVHEIGRVVVGGFRGVGGTIRRMGASLTRRNPTDVEDEALPDEAWDAALEPSDPDDDLLDDPGTAIGAVALANVEWSPTEAPSTRPRTSDWTPRRLDPPSELEALFQGLAPRARSAEGEPNTGTWPEHDDCTTPSGDPSSTPEAVPERVAVPPVPPAASPPPPMMLEDLSEPGVRSRSSAPGAQVRKAAFLDRAVRDDGRAIQKVRGPYQLPPLNLLDLVPRQQAQFDPEELRRIARTVEETLTSFKVTGSVTDVRVGPVVTTLEFLPDSGISVRRIASLADDLAMALCAVSVRVVAPIPGKGVVGIEIPSPQRMNIYLRELLASPEFRDAEMALPCVLGKDVEGRPLVADLAKMPHLLVGGTTGAGKSVGVNGMLLSLLFTRSPEELRLLLVDPKKLEFKMYEDIPHLLHPVVVEPKQAAAALAWACREMDQRYEILARWDTRNITNYNQKVERERASWTPEKARQYAPKDWPPGEPLPTPEKLPYIVFIIDELADLMLVAKKEVEGSIARLTQMARACGIHLIVATQRPSVDVVTGLIKSNLPTRISFKLRTAIDSRTILDSGGAESLLGRGDMLYLPNAGDLARCHGAFVGDDEVGRVVDFLRSQAKPDYIAAVTADPGGGSGDPDADDAERDELYHQAVEVVMQAGKASTSLIQRHLKIGYNRAARIIELMESAGVVGPADGARPREVLVD
ncbi:MAG: DNA translocase FtsK [Deltaproteobacteria bacterium]|nr:DNA translocase FtsK [Deltaproteobacteria bacterium]